MAQLNAWEVKQLRNELQVRQDRAKEKAPRPPAFVCGRPRVPSGGKQPHTLTVKGPRSLGRRGRHSSPP